MLVYALHSYLYPVLNPYILYYASKKIPAETGRDLSLILTKPVFTNGSTFEPGVGCPATLQSYTCRVSGYRQS